METGETLSGAKLVLFDIDRNIIDTWISTIKPYRIEGLIIGDTYILKEELAPKGYEISDDISFVVKNTGAIQLIEMKDKVIEVPPIKEEQIKEIPELPKQLPKTGIDSVFVYYLINGEVLTMLLITVLKFKIKND